MYRSPGVSRGIFDREQSAFSEEDMDGYEDSRYNRNNHISQKDRRQIG